MKKVITGCLMLMTVCTSFGQSIQEAEVMLKGTVNSVLETLRLQDLDNTARREKLIKVLDRAFKFDLMAKISLGRSWQTLNDEQKKIFSELFEQRLKDSYMEKLKLYSEETVTFEDPIMSKPRHLYIPTYLLSNGKRISMLYKLYKISGSWRIYDLEIQGISIISTYRSQFTQALKEGSFNELIESMKAKVEEVPTEE